MKTMPIDVNISLFWNEANDKNTIGSLEKYIGLMINDEDIKFVEATNNKIIKRQNYCDARFEGWNTWTGKVWCKICSYFKWNAHITKWESLVSN